VPVPNPLYVSGLGYFDPWIQLNSAYDAFDTKISTLSIGGGEKNTADKTIAIEIDSNKPVKHHAMRTIHSNVLCIACQEI